jgi:hypothetical protein
MVDAKEDTATREEGMGPSTSTSLAGASLRKWDSLPAELIGFSHEELALTFETVEERDRAIDMIWDETGPLFRLPYDVSDRTTLVVPEGAVDFFTQHGLKFA